MLQLSYSRLAITRSAAEGEEYNHLSLVSIELFSKSFLGKYITKTCKLEHLKLLYKKKLRPRLYRRNLAGGLVLGLMSHRLVGS